ncbi:MAG TPA: tail fiber domain-containing protein [Candidatus Paceibacterota bacterium]|nr:tail fiber domain-containing protein [Candidatus Paceibacterota bacterium]HPT18306.1 tail fiber domain-containing protein [Candidatus Paceibacterota bacterium]
MDTLNFLKIKWHKITSIVLLILLFGAYVNIFAIDQTYDPGETLDPECVPGEVNCTVEIPVSQWTTNGSNIYYDLGNVGIGTTLPNQQLEITQNFRLPSTTYNSGNPYGIIYKGTNPFIHDFNYGNNGTVTTRGRNLFIGESAGNFTMGSTANYSNNSSNNIGIGFRSLYSNTTGSENSAVGNSALYLNTTGSGNSAVGNSALYFNTTGSTNSAIGDYTLYLNTTGSGNSALGSAALYSNTEGNFNSAVGSFALSRNTIGIYNSAIGNRAGSSVGNGDNPGIASSYGVYIGAYAKAFADGGQNEIVIGYDATGNGSNTATIGNSSILRTYLRGVNLAGGTATAGTAPLKFVSGTLLTTPEAGAMEFNGTNLFFTPSSSRKKISFIEDLPITIVNSSSLFSTGLSGTGSGTTAGYSIFLGVDAGGSATGATYSNFLGNGAGLNATSATASNFFGYYAGETATAANHSNFFGTEAGYRATGAHYSNFFGSYAGEFAVNAIESNFFGTSAGDSAENASHSNFIGDNAGNYALNSSHSNFFGTAAGYAAENASNSIFIGYKAGENDTVNNTTNASYYSILIGPSTSTDGNENSIALGGSAKNTASNQFVIGSATSPIDTTVIYGSGGTICTITTGTGIGCSSDENLKTNIVDLDTNTLEKLTQVRTVTFNWKNRNTTSNNIGFIAQDLEKYFPELVNTDPTGYKSVYYANITPILTEAIRELDLKVKEFSSIDVSNENSFASLIKKYLADVANGIEIVFFGEVHTKQLCIDDVCINKDQLQQLLDSSNITNTITSTVTDTDTTENTNLENADDADSDEPVIDSDIDSENIEEQVVEEQQNNVIEDVNPSLGAEPVVEE